MIAYFFHFCQSDFGNLWGSGVVGGEEVGGEAANFSHFPHLRCLLGFLPALKATDFAGFPFLRCFFSFLPTLKAADFAEFPFLRCLFAAVPANPHAPLLRSFRVPTNMRTPCHSTPFL